MLRAAFLLCIVLGSIRTSLAQIPAGGQVKVNFIYNFAKFVTWPSGTFPASSDSFALCAYGKNSVTKALQQYVQGKTVQGRKVAVKAVVNISDARACQVLIIGPLKKGQLNDLLESLQGVPVLTVGETPGFTQAGGIINLIEESDQLRFDVNDVAARKVRLTISSRLLSLAKRVID